MLPICILTKYNVRSMNGVIFHWLKTNVRWCSSSDSSDSDSDSDTEKVKQKINLKSEKLATSADENNLGNFLNNMIQRTESKRMTKITEKIPSEKAEKKDAETTTKSINLTEYVNNMMKATRIQRTVDIALQSRKKFNLAKLRTSKKHISYEKKLESAAEDVANKFGGDKKKITSDLLKKVLSYKEESLKESRKMKNVNNVKDASVEDTLQLIQKLERKSKQSLGYKKQENFTNKEYSAKKSIIQSLLQEYKQRPADPVKISITQQLLEKSKAEKSKSNEIKSKEKMNNMHFYRSRGDLDIWNGEPSRIFENMGVPSPDMPELRTWAALEQKELKALTTHPPANIFQELILWTEQGKLWKFPIDNEQGLEEESNVHFSEHVFMERHLKGWCPKSGPIRHFMELVCVGLSKNPYMTVQEKVSTIMWYKEYFASKQDLLQELGAIQEPFSNEVKQITE